MGVKGTKNHKFKNSKSGLVLYIERGVYKTTKKSG